MAFSWKCVASMVVAHLAALAQAQGEAPLTVQTTVGEVTGFINETAPAVRQFLGLPFAEPPVGSLRFLPPVPAKDAGPINANTYAPACKQQRSSSTSLYTEVLTQFLINGPDSEDCLYVNVYAPLNPVEESLPVFIYIPGGGFTSGGSNSLYKIPDQWIQRTQSHVVVIMQYRVNAFGFPNGAAAHENVGLLDQRLAVEWTRDNSAGGMSSSVYGYGYPEDPIVAATISDSGAASPSNLGRQPGNYTTFSTLAGLVGCGGLADDAAAELECVQAVDANTLQDYISNTSTISFTPVMDNVTSFSNTTDRMAQGLVAKIPAIVGHNANEGASSGVFNEATGPTQATKDGFQAAIGCPVVKEASNRARFGLPTYRYFYEGNFTNISPLPWVGAAHSSELPLLFGTHYEYRGNSTEFEWETSYGMEALWLSFAANSSADPTDGVSVTWPKYSEDTDSLAVFAADDTWVQFSDGSFGAGVQCSS
ncbi:hypothetical protein KVR01_010529 [Diaporthe batatas]|uniref:uncharacterized protein n=1 Tax=Diaporthe batatas TaxID=748121 RepID=UPI001D042DEB|nr:uncharacterized protein KVR01_010529 [Diaporthe batatas]KAG8159892.1 hypothetical protein KVR01_010529 [Diaporthe batatas]